MFLVGKKSNSDVRITEAVGVPGSQVFALEIRENNVMFWSLGFGAGCNNIQTNYLESSV